MRIDPREDALQRDEAARDDLALVRYVGRWERRYARLQGAHPALWHVPGWSDDEVRDAVTLRLVELLRGDATAREALGVAGEPWGLSVAKARLAELRRTFRLRTALVAPPEAPLGRCVESPEEAYARDEDEARLHDAAEQAERDLAAPQRRWLAAFRRAAERGAFFASSDAPNLAEAARELGKHRSSATRAFEALRRRFQRGAG